MQQHFSHTATSTRIVWYLFSVARFLSILVDDTRAALRGPITETAVVVALAPAPGRSWWDRASSPPTVQRPTVRRPADRRSPDYDIAKACKTIERAAFALCDATTYGQENWRPSYLCHRDRRIVSRSSVHSAATGAVDALFNLTRSTM